MRNQEFIDGMNYIRGYHGTFNSSEKEIKEKGFIPSKGKKHWLGDGVYFYRDDKAQAETWTVNKRKYLLAEGKEIAENLKGRVCQLNLIIRDEEFLNLDSQDGAEYMSKLFNDLLESLGIEDTGGVRTKTNLFLMNQALFKLVDKKYKVIQRTYPVKSGRFDKHRSVPLNTLMFLPIKRGKSTSKTEQPYIKTPLLNGCQVVVRDSSLIKQRDLQWFAC